jgi:hypothetical protein
MDTTKRMSTISPYDIIRNKRAGLANLTKKRALGFATKADLERIEVLQKEIDQLHREQDTQRYGMQS